MKIKEHRPNKFVEAGLVDCILLEKTASFGLPFAGSNQIFMHGLSSGVYSHDPSQTYKFHGKLTLNELITK